MIPAADEHPEPRFTPEQRRLLAEAYRLILSWRPAAQTARQGISPGLAQPGDHPVSETIEGGACDEKRSGGGGGG